MKLDKKISLGTLITIATIVGTFIYTQGIFATKIETIESDNNDSRKRIMTNRNKIQELEVGVGKIETKLDERFNRLEELLKDL